MITNSVLAAALSAFGDAMLIPEAAVVFDCGEVGDGAYVVVSGTVDVVMLNMEGTPLWSRKVGPDGILGLPAAIGGYEHCLRAVVGDSAELVFVPANKLAKLVRDNLLIGTEVLRVMSEEVSIVRQKIAMFGGRTGAQA